MFSEGMAKRIEIWPVERLVPYDRNPRTHSQTQIIQIAASIAEFGFVNPVLVASDSGIIAGHGRLEAARMLNLKEVPVIVLDHLTATQRKAYLIADNRLAESAGWDEELLRQELKDLEAAEFDLDVIGFSDDELRVLLEPEEAPAGLTDEDAAPEVPAQPVSRLGDIWQLGIHRLVCGDSTNPDVVQQLMAGEKADLVFTDPPYNVDYQGYTEEKLTLQGDRMSNEDFDHFLRIVFVNYRTVIKPGSSVYVCHASSVQREFQGALEAAGFAVRCQIIWAKNTLPGGSAAISFSTSRFSIATSQDNRMPGMEISRSPPCGRRRNHRPVDYTRP